MKSDDGAETSKTNGNPFQRDDAMRDPVQPEGKVVRNYPARGTSLFSIVRDVQLLDDAGVHTELSLDRDENGQCLGAFLSVVDAGVHRA